MEPYVGYDDHFWCPECRRWVPRRQCWEAYYCEEKRQWVQQRHKKCGTETTHWSGRKPTKTPEELGLTA